MSSLPYSIFLSVSRSFEFCMQLRMTKSAVILCSDVLCRLFVVSFSLCVYSLLLKSLQSLRLWSAPTLDTLLISFVDTTGLIKRVEVMATALALILCPLSHQRNSILHHFSLASSYKFTLMFLPRVEHFITHRKTPSLARKIRMYPPPPHPFL